MRQSGHDWTFHNKNEYFDTKPDESAAHRSSEYLEYLLDPLIFSTLESFTFVQAQEKNSGTHKRCLSMGRAIPCDTSLRHLDIGVIHPREHTRLACWKLPKGLETITLLMSHGDQPHGTSKASVASAEEEMIDGTYRCLEGNPPSDLPGFHRLHIIFTGSSATKVSPACNITPRAPNLKTLHDLEELCASRKLECWISHESKWLCNIFRV